MEEDKFAATSGTSKSLKESLNELSRALMEVYKNEETNPINLGFTMEEYIEMTEVMNTKTEKKSNGFLEGKKTNMILGKRK
ncbi:hypothetical protein [Lysinibacillus sp. Bpr_S20]|uniref:hypothetical protein n=1 Tax=Lysinibacillus sp. Bpr_S20 TaxID=2933964 RepID=UPI0020139DE9|nr:hypothetical protein [Lysinibacillus sp. Bpr_S20]MCL1700788.1 hypothetical protein [Lysinibacillus sp. Bpr_S20]